jgi:colanic acid/amylovoran biosynthesis glycosyltransferase
MATPGDRIGVAHFRRTWFEPTETFLHGLVSGCRATRPLLVGCERANADRFPFHGPILILQAPGSLGERLGRLRARLAGQDPKGRFDTRRARAALARHGARVLHAHFGYTGHQVLSLRRRTGLPLVTSFYGVDASRLGRHPVWRTRYRELFAEGERFLAEGPFLRARLVELGCPPAKTALQPIALDPARYPFRERGPKTRGEPVRVLFCASFLEKKGLPYALRAVARVREEHPTVELALAGDGPGRDAADVEIDRLGLSNAVRRLGFVSHARMIEEMNAADLFIQPSVTAADGNDEGGAPTTILEAQACGLPVLATHHADIPNVVSPGESALLAPERDEERLAANLATLVKEPERWAAMGRAGRERILRGHDVADRVSRLEHLYAELAGGVACSPA